MKNYKHVVVAVELAKSDATLIEHAKQMVHDFKFNVVLVHAVEHIGAYSAYGMGVGIEIERALVESAQSEMKKLGKHIGIPETRQVVQSGPAKFIILDEAEKNKADLIIVGSHGRHGLRAILGSTANAVLHGARCDVLAVRLKD